MVVVLDNLKIHHAKILDDVYDRDFKEMFLPPYSCELNPIERLWSVLKRKWAQNLYYYTEELTQQRSMRNTTKKTIEKIKEMLGKTILFQLKLAGHIETNKVQTIARSHFRAMVGVLEGNLV